MRKLAALLVCVVSWLAWSKEQFVVLSHEPLRQLPSLVKQVRVAYRNAGIRIDVRYLPSKRAIITSQESDWVDAVMARVPEFGEMNSGFVRVPVPLWRTDIGSVMRKQSDRVFTWQDLNTDKGLRVGALRGIIAIEKQLNRGEIVYVNTAEQGVSLVNRDRIDVFVLPLAYFPSNLPPDAYQNVKLCTRALAKVELFHFIHTRHEHLLPVITAELATQFPTPFVADLSNTLQAEQGAVGTPLQVVMCQNT